MKKCKECTPTPMMALNEVSCIYYQKVHAKEPRINKSYRYILYHLANKDGISQLEIANLTHLKPPTISITLHAMEEAGYVVRSTDEKDKRQVNVFLTAKGKRYNSEVSSLLKRTEAVALEGLTEEEKAAFMETLKKIKDNLVK